MLTETFGLQCDQKEVLDRISVHPGLRKLGCERIDDHNLQLGQAPDFEQLVGWVRDYGASLKRA